MIVIITHNGKKYLIDLLSDLNNFNCTLPISIIDTGSDNDKSLFFLTEVKNIFPNLNIEVYKTPEKNREAGAIVYAMKNIKAERYYFLQDSIRILQPSIFREIDKLLQHKTVVTISYFKSNFYDSNEQRKFVYSLFNSTDYDIGIFGSMFSILKKDIDENYNTLPKVLSQEKWQACGMERGWAVWCKINNIKIVPLDKMIGNNLFYIKKIRCRRK